MKRNLSVRYSLINCIFYAVPGIVLFAIWFPIICHYYIPNVVLTNESVKSARVLPSDSILNELDKFPSLGIYPLWDSKEQLIGTAEKILRGEVEIPGFPSIKISIPFAADDIDKGLPSNQLLLADFTILDVLLDAYKLTGRVKFLMIARDIILGWALYERKAWVPKGFLWNDHAVAARIKVLGKFWRYYRRNPDYQPGVAKDILQLVSRSGQFLSNPSHFTFSSNHGVMENLALWHLCLAFPTLPNIKQYKQLALDRMRDQMTYYINGEGVVLEHSAFYQKFGLELLSMALRYCALLNLTPPEEWWVKYTKAKDFYAQLRRPDGSLPQIGDTHSVKSCLGPLITEAGANKRSNKFYYCQNWKPLQQNSLYPIAGYSVWWDKLNEWPNSQKLAQTVIAWSYYPGHAHKHADEMSVLLWADGQTWWTNTGYWPYGTIGRSEAESWNGSNAPHLLQERTYSARHTRLCAYGWSNDLALLDLERKGPQQYIARRQVVHIKPNLWVIIDHTANKGNCQTATIWTTAHNVHLTKGKIPGSYHLQAENNLSLTEFIIGSIGMKVRQLKGSMHPFAGWDYTKPASAIMIEQPSNSSWAAVVWSLNSGVNQALQIIKQPYMQHWGSAENWNIELPAKSGLISIGRQGAKVWVNINGDLQRGLTLMKLPKIANEVNSIKAAYENVEKKYPIFRDNLYRRYKVTYILLFCFIIQEIFIIIYNKISGKWYLSLRIVNMLGWVGAGIWLVIRFG